MSTLKRIAIGLAVLGALAGYAVGQIAGDTGAQRQAIATQRQQLLQKLESQDRACEDRFFVTDCRAQVETQRRKALAEFKRQELALDDAQRAQRAVEQQQNLVDKQLERQERDNRMVDPDNTPAVRLQRQAEKQAAHIQQAQSQQRPTTQPKTPSGPDAAARQRSKQAYEDKQKALEQRRVERDQRLREHPSTAAPLPSQP